LWDSWYTDGINLKYIQARSEVKPVGLVIAEPEKLQGRKKLSTLEHKLKDQINLSGGKQVEEWIIPQKMKMYCSTKDVNESFHKTEKWIVPQKQTKKNRSTETEIERFVDE
jgi:hypothetical protein